MVAFILLHMDEKTVTTSPSLPVNDAPTWSLLPGRRHEFFSHTKDPIQESNNNNLRKLGVLSKY